MNNETIQKIEQEFPKDGLTGLLFFKFTGGDSENICEVAILEKGVGLVLKGTAPISERRKQFLMIYDGCRKIADFIKRTSNDNESEVKEGRQSPIDGS